MKLIFLLLMLTPVALAQVSYERIRGAAAEPEQWLTYSGNYQGHRHSLLKQIDTSNVARLRPVWMYQMRDPGKVVTTPLVVDGVIYISEKPHAVSALDARTGRPLWTYRRTVPPDVRACCGQPSRGVAILGDTLFMGTMDARLVALDIRTGKPRWDVVVADYKTGHSITVAPLVLKDKVIVGIAGGEYGIRGFLDAYDAKTGKQSWRFWTTPGPGEPGHDTWAGDSWKTGAAPTWVTGVYDPELNLLYWGTGNPGPDWNGDTRAGDNLYSNCLLALNPDTGKLKWYFQFTPHDVHDWDANQTPILIEGAIDGRQRKLVITANRNGFYYTLDRETGQFLRGAAFVKQTWAKGLDEKGRPVLLPGKEPSAEGTLLYPGIGGGTNWQSPAWNPQTRLFYVMTEDGRSHVYYKRPEDYHSGELFEGGGFRTQPGDEPPGAIKAIEPETGKIRWEYKTHSYSMAGVMSTAGGLVFGAAEGHFLALDAVSGKPLWNFQTGGRILANPVSWQLDGKQYVGISSALSFIVFALDEK
ncbi:MAG: pyrroloquinoline quinone-dependent dehydrogenase [Blastocatellia bacterium]